MDAERARPFTISVMGQTGTGKTSLINALFGTDYPTSPVRATTREVTQHVHRAENGELHFFDMPGLGEFAEGERRIAEYRKHLIESDVALWTIHSDSKSVTFDRQMLAQILGDREPERSQLMNKITFVLTKVDVLVPTPWIFHVDRGDDTGLFAPNDHLAAVLAEKEDHFALNLIEPFSDGIVAVTFNDTGFEPRRDRAMTVSGRAISHSGRFTAAMAEQYTLRHPAHRDIFRRLRDYHRIIPISARFQYGLTKLMTAIVNKLGPFAVGRFEKFTDEQGDLDRMQLSRVKAFCNMTIYDDSRREYLFSLAHDIMLFRVGHDSAT
jgi:predicted GTPase